MTQENALINMKSGKNIFLTGDGGTGKSYTIKKFLSWLRSKKISYKIAGSTGISIINYTTGSTVHSLFGLGIQESAMIENDMTHQKIMANPYKVKMLKSFQVLVIEEVSMTSKHIISSIDIVLKSVYGNSLPFGGIQVIFVGDFAQLPPVNKNPSESIFAFQSQAWHNASVETCYLTEKFRTNDDRLATICDEAKIGRLSDNSKQLLNSRIITDDMSFIPDIQLFTTNRNKNEINILELAKLTTEPKLFKHCENTTGKQGEYRLNSFKKSKLTEDNLTLKVGAMVMTLVNDQDSKFVNGSIGKVLSFMGDSVEILIKGKKVIIEPHKWELKNDKGTVVATYIQLPIALAWAITIHKSQGMTIDAPCKVDLTQCFEHGQAYVALSRLTTLDNLFLVGIDYQRVTVHPLIEKVIKRIQA